TRAIKEARKSYEKMYDEYGHRSKTKDQADWKSLYHAVRIAGECKELLSTSWITLPRPDAEYLKRIRLGDFHYDAVIDRIDEIIAEIDNIESKLPSEPDKEWINSFLIHTNKNIILGK